MSEKTNDGGPAFPFVEPPTQCSVNTGMTLRDYFAGQALTGVVIGMNIRSQPLGDHNTEYVTGCCYEIADAMLAARARNGNGGEG